MVPSFGFRVTSRLGSARRGELTTAHGTIQTPAFMPVGTQGAVKGVLARDLLDLGVEIMLSNTYHLYLRPGDALVARHGGLHRFIGWDRPILTDSGGYQAFSLGARRTIDEHGISFRSHLDGAEHVLTPEHTTDIQANLGSDIAMVLDECLGFPATRDETAASTDRTLRWAQRCRERFLELRAASQEACATGISGIARQEACATGISGIARQEACATGISGIASHEACATGTGAASQEVEGGAAGRRGAEQGRPPVASREPRAGGVIVTNPGQAQFGIVQGGTELDLRAASARATVDLGFEGYAVGGLSVGEPIDLMYEVAAATCPSLPADRPRYLMGTGTPLDLVECAALGFDLFDCVMPTRNARNGQLFTREGRLNIRNRRHADDQAPPDPACSCYTCRHHSRAYLRHLHMAGEISAATLATLHNLAFYLDTMRRIREAIVFGSLDQLKLEYRQTFARRSADS